MIAQLHVATYQILIITLVRIPMRARVTAMDLVSHTRPICVLTILSTARFLRLGFAHVPPMEILSARVEMRTTPEV